MNPDDILQMVLESLSKISDKRRAWLDKHLITPREITLWLQDDRQAQKNLWLVTDHTGVNDSPYRIVFDEPNNMFGLEMTSDDGTEFYLGPHALEFSEVVDLL